jgi:hypothetical protein
MNARKNNTKQLRFENLESRQMMAGNVYASVVSGDLVVRGDNASNGVEVRQIGNGAYQVRGLTQGGYSTGVNGYSWMNFYGVKDDIVMYGNGGHDYLSVTGSSNSYTNIKDELFIYGGTGNDVTNVSYVSTGRDLYVDSGTGRDSTYVYSSFVRDDLTIQAGATAYGDYDYASVAQSTIGSAAYRGSLNFSGTGGADTLAVRNTITDDLFASMYGGNDQLDVRNSRVRYSSRLDGGYGYDTLNRANNNTLLSYTGIDRWTYYQ